MKKADVRIGARYIAKVSGSLAVIRIDRENPYGGWDATNTETGRKIHVRTAARLRRPTTTPQSLEEQRLQRRALVEEASIHGNNDMIATVNAATLI